MNGTSLDKRQVRVAFDRAAESYDQAASLQRVVADRLLERLDQIKVVPRTILDAGAGTGYCLPLLRKRYGCEVIALDIAPGMLRKAQHRGRWFSRAQCLCADIERLPLASATMDLVVSNLTLQWCDTGVAFRELGRILASGGLLLFSTFGPDTLKEVRTAWSGVDDQAHVHDFADMHDLGDDLIRVGLGDPVLDVDRITVRYRATRDIITDLKRLGAHNARKGRFSGLTGKHRFRLFEERLAALAEADGRIPVTFEVVYGHAWAQTPSPAGASSTPVRWLGRTP